MSADLQSILGNWQYDPASINARWIMGVDGRPRIQLRLDLGLLQMEASGRPDGARPRGATSLLDYYTERQKRAGGSVDSFRLSTTDIAELQQESAQFYYRYIALYALREMEGVISDTDHNLQIIQLAARHADSHDVAWLFQQFYPNVRMMNARAKAEEFSESNAYDEAIKAVDEGTDDIRRFWLEHSDEEARHPNRELELLQDLREDIKRRKPRSPEDRLREELARAIASENYEKAAFLRDKLNAIARPTTSAE